MTHEAVLDETSLPLALPREAFVALINQTSKKLYRHIRRMVVRHADTDDILQNTYIKVWERWEQLRNNDSLTAWLYRIATNEAISFIRASRRLQQLSPQEADAVLQQLSTQGGYFDADKAQWRLQQALLTLPDQQRAVFCLRYFDEMTYTQMAEVLDVSEGALKASYHLAKQKIELFLQTD
jgi:RNA polymerase sigma-70 factor (ECF subfamily)